MAKTITRQTLTQFGSSGATANFGQFGSQAAGSAVTTKNIATIQALTAWLNGLQSAVAAGQAPYLQDVNSLFYVLFYQLVYLMQEGVPEWDSGTTYFIGSVVKRPSAPEYYSSLTDTNLNNALPAAGTSNTNWQFLNGLISGSWTLGAPLNMQTQKITAGVAATASTDFPIFSQVTPLFHYRRPNLVYNSSTVVNAESGLDGTSGDVVIAFPDGTVRVDSDVTRVRCTLSQTAVFNSATRASNIGGVRSGTGAANTWYAIYAVKVTAGSGSATDFVLVADTVLPIQANYATLNTNFGTNGWVYLGTIAYGDSCSATTSICRFRQNGNVTLLSNLAAGFTASCVGVRVAGTTAASTISWSISNGTAIASAQTPNNFGNLYMYLNGLFSSSAIQYKYVDTTTGLFYANPYSASANVLGAALLWLDPTLGILLANVGAASVKYDIFTAGWIDNALSQNSQI